MKLTAYLGRIGYKGDARPDQNTLADVVRAHIFALPFENLDVQLGRPLTTDIDAAYEKIVERGRGGWCYEMNGLLGWALGEIGFDVTRLAGGVMRAANGDDTIGNHLCLAVTGEREWLVDVGFGGSLIAPLEFSDTDARYEPYRVTLSKVDGEFWRFSEDAGDGAFTYDFTRDRADEKLLTSKCQFLQSDDASPFVQNLVAQRRQENAHLILRGRVFNTITAAGKQTRIIQNENELSDVIHSVFGIDEPSVERLWPKICARHAALFGDSMREERSSNAPAGD